MSVERLTEDQLAARSGTTPEELRRLASLGILSLAGDGGYPEDLIPRVRLALHLERSGISLEDVHCTTSAGRLSLSFPDRLFGRPIAMLEMSPPEAAAALDIPNEIFTEVQTTLGIPGRDGLIRADDAELLRLLTELLRLGLEERPLARFFQVVVENLRRTAQASREMWAAGVQQPLLAQGLSRAQLLEAEAVPAPQAQQLGEAIITVLWNRFLEHEIFQSAVENLDVALEEEGVGRRRAPTDPAIALLDLTGYTSLTERSGDEAAAANARALVDVVRLISMGFQGRLVKTMGDGAMFHFENAGDAVGCALELVGAVPAAGMPPARVGINAGPLIVRDADFYGRTVNIAARLVEYARPREVLVTDLVVAASTASGVAYEEIGPVNLKGVPDPVTVYAAKRQ